jgi:tetratricopeptide (TPR) repeat protein
MHDDDQGRAALPARLTPAEREFFIALRRLADSEQLSPDVLADITSSDDASLPGLDATGPLEALGSAEYSEYTPGQWQQWLDGHSLPPRRAIRALTRAVGPATAGAGSLVDLWATAFRPSPYPQEPGAVAAQPLPPLSAVPGPRAGEQGSPAADGDASASPLPPGTALDSTALDSTALDSAAQAALDQTYRLLSEPAARLLRLLSEHPGPDTTLPAAASLAASQADEARAALAELAKAGLVTEHVPGRFTWPAGARRYAAGRAAELDGALARLLDHYLRTMRVAVPRAYPGGLAAPASTARPGTQPERFASTDQARAWCNAELPVALALVARAAERGLDDFCWQIPSVMAPFLARSAFLHDFLDIEAAALAAAERLASPVALGHAHYNFAHACALLGEVTDAERHLQEALRGFTSAGDQAAGARTLNGMAQVLIQRGEYARARDLEQEALSLRLAVGEPDEIAHSEETLGSIYSRLGDHDLALRHCYRALDISRETGQRLLTADALNTLAFISLALGDPRRAIASYMEVLAIYRQAGEKLSIATALTGLGDAQQAAGDYPAARVSWQQAVTLLHDQPGSDAQPLRARLARVRPPALGPRPDTAAPLRAQDGGGGAGGGRRGVGYPRQRLLIVGGGDEPRLEGRRRQVHPAVEHRVKERGVRGRGLVLGRREVTDRARAAEEEGEQAARGGQVVRDAGLVQGRRHELGQRPRERVHRRVHVRGARLERGQPGRRRQRVAGQRARLVNRPGRSKAAHDVRPPAERGARQPAAHHLAERHQVAANPVDAVPARRRHPEPGQHLVHDQQRAASVAHGPQQLVEPGRGGHHAHVRRAGLGNDARDLRAPGGEQVPDRVRVVVRQHDRVGRRRAGHPG